MSWSFLILSKKRRVRVLLPKNYSQDTNKTYPVVYFHDGQNVLYSKESFSGHSWKVIPTIKRNPDIEKMIVVAIDNDGQRRMNEYSAWKFQESNIPGIQFGGKGTEYAEFVDGSSSSLSLTSIIGPSRIGYIQL